MAGLIYSALMSIDGYVADSAGKFEWAAPDPEVHAAVNDLERGIGTYLYGRRMYEVMAAWEDPALADGQPDYVTDFSRLWRAAEKIVYSTTIADVSTAKTRLERKFDPQAVRQLKASADRDISVGGPQLAACAIQAGLVDEYHLFACPIIVGSGTSAFPAGARVALALVGERRFGNGVVQLHYVAKGGR